MRAQFIGLFSVLIFVSCGSSGEGVGPGDTGSSPETTASEDISDSSQTDAVLGSDTSAPLLSDTDSPPSQDTGDVQIEDDVSGSPLPDTSTPEDLTEIAPCTEPLEWVCADSQQLHKCNVETGVLEYAPCEEGAVCTASQCREVICELDSKECTSKHLYRQCVSEGTAWMDDLPCEEGTECDADTDTCVVPPPECPLLPCMLSNESLNGECVPEYEEAGKVCDDGSQDTHSDQCDEEHNCVGTTIVCEEMVCHDAGVPNGVDCDYAPSEGGTACNDGANGTANDSCDGEGACIGEPITCEEKLCYQPGVPNGVDCDFNFAEAGSSCNDNDLSTKNDVCSGEGLCTGTPIVCEAIQCMVGFPNGEGCIYASGDAGIGCDDENDNTAEDSCDGNGNCVGEPIVCELAACIVNSWPNGIDCTFDFASVGTPCDDGMGDTLNDTCDEFGNCYGTPFAETCDCTANTGASVDALICAMEIGCHPLYVGTTSIYSPTGDNLNNAYKAVNRFGSDTNDLEPHAGDSYALLATGIATGTFHSKSLPGGSPGTDPFSPGGGSMYDAIELSVELTTPPGAKGFSLEYVFFSEEFDDYVGSSFNDKFYIVMNGPLTTNGLDKVINFTDCRNPSDYFDLSGAECPLESGYCCYIAINTALSECCWYNGCPNGTWTTDIGGTGFECANSEWADNQYTGSSTGWLTTTWTSEPGETFTLKFHVHDTGDSVWDSEVLLDNFRWEFEEVTPGTGISGAP